MSFYKKSFSQYTFLVFWIVGIVLGAFFFLLISSPVYLSPNSPSFLSLIICHFIPIVTALHFIQQGRHSLLNILLTVKGFLLGYSVCLLQMIGPLVLFSQYCCDLILLWICIPDCLLSSDNPRTTHRSGLICGFTICLLDFFLLRSLL